MRCRKLCRPSDFATILAYSYCVAVVEGHHTWRVQHNYCTLAKSCRWFEARYPSSAHLDEPRSKHAMREAPSMRCLQLKRKSTICFALQTRRANHHELAFFQTSAAARHEIRDENRGREHCLQKLMLREKEPLQGRVLSCAVCRQLRAAKDDKNENLAWAPFEIHFLCLFRLIAGRSCSSSL